jgi:hypothetical protein
LETADLKTLDTGKAVQTRNGLKARIVTLANADPAYPIGAMVTHPNGFEKYETYTREGHVDARSTRSLHDLVNIPTTLVQYCNQFADGTLGTFTDEPTAAPRGSGRDRFRVALLRSTTILEPTIQPPVFDIVETYQITSGLDL